MRRGWLSSGLQETWESLDLLAQEGCKYVCDWTNDDQPYPLKVKGRQFVSRPNQPEWDDVQQLWLRRNNTPPCWNSKPVAGLPPGATPLI